LEIKINGESRDVPDQITIQGLVTHLGLASDRLAVERNREVVGRPQWHVIVLEESDQVEIIHFVGGGGTRRSDK
jgi:thiamine biosynthesis protein ThiS